MPDPTRSRYLAPSGSRSRVGLGLERAGRVARLGAGRCCSRRARRRWGCRGGRPRPGTGCGRGRGRAPTGRRRRRRCPSRRSGRRRRTARCSGPKREGLMLTIFGGQGRGLDVGDRVDRRVPGDAVGDRVEDRPGLVVDVGVLEPGLGEGLDQLPVELGSVSTSTGVPLYWPFRSSESTAPVSTSSAISSSVQSLVGSSLKRRSG